METVFKKKICYRHIINIIKFDGKLIMRKALNFDLDTKKYEEITGKSAPTAYYQIQKFLENRGFEHRQGSGYVSSKSLNDAEITSLTRQMGKAFSWLRDCLKQFDVTNVGSQYSLLQIMSDISFNQEIEHKSNEIDNNVTNNIEDDIDYFIDM